MSSASTVTSDPAFKDVLPNTFLYGFSTASHQIEGGYLADGKGLGVWDKRLEHQQNGNVASDSYHLWRDDIDLLKQYGCTAYRFSIAWPRVKPQGGADSPVNEAGIRYYSDLIDALLAAGIQPCVTIFHWDLPLHLEDKYGGFESEQDIVRDFVAYANVLFERLGDRVKNWITINEPHIFSFLSNHELKPASVDRKSFEGRFARTLLLCHARTVDLYRRKYQQSQQGVIGVTLYADAIYLGRFPKDPVAKEGAEYLYFTDAEWALVKGSSDFFGVNHYGSYYVSGKMLDPATVSGPALGFGPAEKFFEKDGQKIGNPGQDAQPHDVPWGFRNLLGYISKRYTAAVDQPIYVTENGFVIDGEARMSLKDRINDMQRQHYFAGYLEAMLRAVRDDNIKVGGYMAWSLMDNLEWAQGYNARFGVTVVDWENGCKRTPKRSAFVVRDIFAHALRR